MSSGKFGTDYKISFLPIEWILIQLSSEFNFLLFGSQTVSSLNPRNSHNLKNSQTQLIFGLI